MAIATWASFCSVDAAAAIVPLFSMKVSEPELSTMARAPRIVVSVGSVVVATAEIRPWLMSEPR